MPSMLFKAGIVLPADVCVCAFVCLLRSWKTTD